LKQDIVLRLLEVGLLTEEQVQAAQRLASSEGGSALSHLLRMGVLTEQDLLRFLSDHFGTPGIHLDETEIDPAVIRLIPAEVATKYQVIPVRREGRKLVVAMANPANFFAIDDIKFITGLEVEALVATETQIRRAVDKYYDSAESMAEVMKSIEDDIEVVEEEEEEEAQGADLGADEAPVVKFVSSLISDAVRRGASDIHIEPYEKTLRVRFRIDGTLYEMMRPPFRLRSAIISRLKIMADLDIAERRVPQDGRIKIRLKNKVVDLRVSTLPCVHGEKVVLRILDKSNLNVDLTRLGFEPDALEKFLRAIEAPYGIVLVTGPTGSGKTTTLYSALTRLNRPEVNIMTAEDPVEYNLDGINQVNINEAVNLTFASALRSFLRQDPNIIMVGEIRDGETASIAVKAALTGHLVLSTVHTNDAPSTLGRLLDMGVEPFLVASSMNLVLAQRLVRKVCPKCREPVALNDELLRELQMPREMAETAQVFRGKGCMECNNTGYRGRVGVYEVMPMSTRLREMVLERASALEIKRQALLEGMKSLRMDALLKLARGITSPEEVLKETAPDEEETLEELRRAA
jgi:type IV pilus assembly protein PilB